MIVLAQQVASHPLSPMQPLLFYVFAALTVGSAWAIVLSQNIIRMAVYLLTTLAGVAAIYFMLNAEFLAAIQLIVYAGGTLILIVFGVMLTSKNPFMQLVTSPLERALGLFIAASVAVMAMVALLNSPVPGGAAAPAAPAGHDHVARIGRALLSDYLVPFELAAVLLLVVMVAAAYMARRTQR
ncbi:MAG: NADH-quinone oxidoreductase subunit J [Planctomycetota bacterium]|nr:NADH-quinone oxidoreductase subunit J [Planctomycetota bacterium]